MARKLTTEVPELKRGAEPAEPEFTGQPKDSVEEFMQQIEKTQHTNGEDMPAAKDDLYNREEVQDILSGQVPLIYYRMTQVMASMEAIVKKKQSSGVSYAFRSIEDVMNVLHPILVKHQVFVVPTAVETEHSHFEKEKVGRDNRAYMQMNFRSIVRQCFRFYTIDGSYIDAQLAAEALDQSDKATQQASSYTYKNLILQTFCVPTVDLQDDGDGKKPEVTGDKPTPQSRLADAPKLADVPKRVENAITAATPEEWGIIKSWFKPFLPLGFDAHAFHTWSIKTLRANGLEVPDMMEKLPRASALVLNSVAEHCNKIGGVVHRTDEDKDAGDYQIMANMPEEVKPLTKTNDDPFKTPEAE